MDSKDLFSSVVLALVFTAGVAITVSTLWFEYRRRMKVLDVLRAYAERGEEPPASVIEAAYGRTPRQPPKVPTRGHHLAHAAPTAIFAIGLAALAWWRFSAFGETGASVIVPALAALFSIAGMAARLVGAYYAPDR